MTLCRAHRGGLAHQFLTKSIEPFGGKLALKLKVGWGNRCIFLGVFGENALESDATVDAVPVASGG